MKDLIIVGAGGHGREVLEWILDINEVKPTWNVLGFIDDDEKKLDEKKSKYKVIGKISEWVIEENQCFALGIASPQIKEKVTCQLLERGAEFVSVVHPTVRIAESATYGDGLVAYPYSAIGPDAKVGDFVTLLSTKIGHDASVGDYTTISSNCGVNGGVILGKRVFLGNLVAIVPDKKIGDDVYVGLGSVVINDIESNTKVFGNPARKTL
ncbi:sugar O-acyltransferase, sialic acid O-acetyltransferase NeuD family [Schinkia azotoformans MEV2011]|uniref:Sugar O-acyltransferase, sialic acid O-acetyltransferase NeuD family n=1 Tax=Schinkia azotoformans MEV2011 TaxID=1348973 RepID=A0A072NPL6_SCHAZ|nr:NeuD/PglB/VioB family sugar acetyltransferase [Schinkia azotoformans]KEF38873.1 sugar O-acyltransferase, sialic acid O-acetyltransferase NeuD family [Schinkia azotoformans MEV2011]MEC1696776.1 NeuD/PglB/VioB family sugar acetyltransferase [Schinkia azotoformans]MEC1725015.1 NeuD/PglB/VioB family sugar acetyltransferase [Schinkia azotoformans]MEC1741750.1 NeuD/PglB/VioB family sugar acetyltransferase [Schinkia azotoformans]MEC1766572.1 NeuD/PglB/VioB family sugar acetyltransferase [Schinkia 